MSKYRKKAISMGSVVFLMLLSLLLAVNVSAGAEMAMVSQQLSSNNSHNMDAASVQRPSDLDTTSNSNRIKNAIYSNLESITDVSYIDSTDTTPRSLLSSSSGGHVLWDLTHESYYKPSDNFSTLASVLNNSGYTISTTDVGMHNVDLSNYQIVVVTVSSNSTNFYTSSEVSAIETFVQNGGGLLIIADHPGIANATINPVAEAFGSICGVSHLSSSITNFSAHPIFNGVSQINYSAGGEITAASPAQLVAFDSNGKGAVAVAESGLGRVVVVGDLNGWDNPRISQADNQLFAQNAFDWLSGGHMPISTVAISGATTLMVGTSHTFTSTVTPITATTPITYVWQMTGQSPVTDTSDITNTLPLSWTTLGLKTISVSASNGVGAVTDTHTVMVEVPIVTLNLTGSSIAENGGQATVVAILSAAAGEDVTVDLGFSGTATNGSDYTASANSIVIPAGSLSGSVTLTGVDDALDEVDESLVVDITNVSNGTEDGVQQVTATITDDDEAQISIGDVTVSEGDTSETVTAVFPLTLSVESTNVVSVTYSTANDSATAADDYVAISGTVSFNPLETSKMITVTVNGDGLAENNETFFVNLTNPLSVTIADAQGVGTITDDDEAQISIGDVTVSEGNTSETVEAVFPLTLSVESTNVVSVTYSTANGSATVADDYVAISGTVSFNPLETTQMVTITVNGDLIDEDDEHFFVNLSNASHATIADGQGIGTITDDDEAQISIADVTVSEGDTSETVAAVFELTLSQPSSHAITLTYSTANNTATAPDDYVAISGTVTLQPLETSKMLTVTVNGDGLAENDETFFVNLTTPLSVTIADAQGMGTIRDDDGNPTLSINDVSANEGDGSMSFTVSLSAASALPVEVSYATNDNTATVGNDYTATSSRLTIPAGNRTAVIAVNISDDALDEENESFYVNLSNATNATIADSQGVGTITDNDSTPTLSINDVSANEDQADGTMIFEVRLSAVSALSVTANFTTIDDTALAGSDYEATDGSFTIPPGTSSYPITVNITDDTLHEESERFTVELSNAVNATIADEQAVGTILDNESKSATISIDDASVDEAAGTMSFSVSLSEPSGFAVEVDFRTTDGTAIVGSDYSSTFGRLIIPAGENSKQITVNITDDTLYEGDETFTVELSNATNATIADNEGVGTITDNEVMPSLSIDDANADEGDGSMSFSVSLSEESGLPVEVNFATTDGSATEDSDYSNTSSRLIIPAGESSRQITVNITDDTLDEENETFTVELSNATHATIADNQGVGTIMDNDEDEDEVVAPTAVTIHGAETGSIESAYTFTATVEASDTTTPITYTWQASGQDTVSHISNELEDSVTFEWATTGAQPITVRAENASGAVSSSELITILDADLIITEIDAPDSLILGNQLTYTVSIMNNGPSSAEEVELLDDLPSDVTFHSAEATQGSCQQAEGEEDQVTCQLGTLANGESATITILVTPTKIKRITNQARVLSNTPDSDESNNIAIAETVVQEEGIEIISITPDSSFNDVPSRVYINGFGFEEPLTVTLDQTALHIVSVQPDEIVAVVGAEIVDPGLYDITVRTSSEEDTLPSAYELLDAALVDDLQSSGPLLSTNPFPLQVGNSENSLALTVQKMGDEAAPSVTVAFHLNSAQGPRLGEGVTEPIEGFGKEKTSPVPWQPEQSGTYTICAIIDPNNEIKESDEENNEICRRILVLPAKAADIDPPEVNSLLMNGGAEITDNVSVKLDTEAIDPGGSGVDQIMFSEFEYIHGAHNWVPVQQSEWLNYEVVRENYPWTLKPIYGVRYLKAWATDKQGNISLEPAESLIDLVPTVQEGELFAGGVDVYRIYVEKDQALNVTMTPGGQRGPGDADVFVWSPNSQLQQPKSCKGVEEIPVKASVTGTYQIEVHAFNGPAAYRLQFGTQLTQTDRTSAEEEGCQQPDGPAVPPGDEPEYYPDPPLLPPVPSYSLYIPVAIH